MKFIDIIGTLFDNSINHVVALAELVLDRRLNKSQQEINEDLYSKIQNPGNLENYATEDFVNEKISEIVVESPEVDLSEYYTKNLIQDIINNLTPKHIFLTQELYDSLNGVYAKDTLYYIVEKSINEEIGNVLGEKLPIRLGKGIGEAFGEKLPIRLYWAFGNKFPITVS